LSFCSLRRSRLLKPRQTPASPRPWQRPMRCVFVVDPGQCHAPVARTSSAIGIARRRVAIAQQIGNARASRHAALPFCARPSRTRTASTETPAASPDSIFASLRLSRRCMHRPEHTEPPARSQRTARISSPGNVRSNTNRACHASRKLGVRARCAVEPSPILFSAQGPPKYREAVFCRAPSCPYVFIFCLHQTRPQSPKPSGICPRVRSRTSGSVTAPAITAHNRHPPKGTATSKSSCVNKELSGCFQTPKNQFGRMGGLCRSCAYARAHARARESDPEKPSQANQSPPNLFHVRHLPTPRLLPRLPVWEGQSSLRISEIPRGHRVADRFASGGGELAVA
jgi:hypothetical protein